MEDKWISVKDATPEFPDEWVLCCSEYGIYVYCFQYHNGEFYPYGMPSAEKNITHWRSLPVHPAHIHTSKS